VTGFYCGVSFASRYEYFVVVGCLPAPVPFVYFLHHLLLLLLLLFVSYEFWRASGYDSGVSLPGPLSFIYFLHHLFLLLLLLLLLLVHLLLLFSP